jgi:hypothetical protein
MNKPTSLADNETVIEFVSSHVVRSLKEKKKFRRRLIVLLLAVPKILIVLYFGVGDLFESHRATAADPAVVLKAAAPSHP